MCVIFSRKLFWNFVNVIIIIDTICLTRIVKLLGDNQGTLLNRQREKERAKERKEKKKHNIILKKNITKTQLRP